VLCSPPLLSVISSILYNTLNAFQLLLLPLTEAQQTAVPFPRETGQRQLSVVTSPQHSNDEESQKGLLTLWASLQVENQTQSSNTT